MLAAKQEALQIIAEMPDDADMNEIMYRLYVLDKVRKGQDAATKGEIVTSDELEREIESW